MSMNFIETQEFIKMARKATMELGATKVPCLYGPAGIGKTELVKELCQENGWDCIVLHVSQLEPTDLTGLPNLFSKFDKTMSCAPVTMPFLEKAKFDAMVSNGELNEEEQEILSHGGIINPNGGILFLDEVNRGRPDIQQAMFQLLQDRKMHTFTLPDNYTIVAAANPSGGAYEVADFDPALVDRLAWVDFKPELNEFVSFLGNKHCNQETGEPHPFFHFLKDKKELLDITCKEDTSMEDLKLNTPRAVDNAMAFITILKNDPVWSKDFAFQGDCLRTVLKKDIANEYIDFEKNALMALQADEILGAKDDKERKVWVDKLAALKKNNIASALYVTTERVAVFMNNYEFPEVRTAEAQRIFDNLLKFVYSVDQTYVAVFYSLCQGTYYVDKEGHRFYNEAKGLEAVKNTKNIWKQPECRGNAQGKYAEGSFNARFKGLKNLGDSGVKDLA